MKKKYIIPIFVPHLGCPNDCIFCNQKAISGQKNKMTKEKAKKIIDEYLKVLNNNEAQIEIAFFGGSFTAIDEKLQEELLQTAHEYIKNPSDLFNVGDIVDCYVEKIDLEHKKVSLTLLND